MTRQSVFFCVSLQLVWVAYLPADIVWSGFNLDAPTTLDISGEVSLSVNGLDIGSTAADGSNLLEDLILTNASQDPDESVQFDLAGTFDGVPSAEARLIIGNTGGLGVNYIGNGADETTNIDGKRAANGASVREGIQLRFDSPIAVRTATFVSLDWDSASDFEVVEWVVNGNVVHSLFKGGVDGVDQSLPVFQNATGAIASSESGQSPVLNLSFATGDTLEFRINGTPLLGSISGAQAGFRLGQITFVAVPEPAAVWMMGAIGLLFAGRSVLGKCPMLRMFPAIFRDKM